MGRGGGGGRKRVVVTRMWRELIAVAGFSLGGGSLGLSGLVLLLLGLGLGLFLSWDAFLAPAMVFSFFLGLQSLMDCFGSGVGMLRCRTFPRHLAVVLCGGGDN